MNQQIETNTKTESSVFDYIDNMMRNLDGTVNDIRCRHSLCENEAEIELASDFHDTLIDIKNDLRDLAMAIASERWHVEQDYSVYRNMTMETATAKIKDMITKREAAKK